MDKKKRVRKTGGEASTERPKSDRKPAKRKPVFEAATPRRHLRRSTVYNARHEDKEEEEEKMSKEASILREVVTDMLESVQKAAKVLDKAEELKLTRESKIKRSSSLDEGVKPSPLKTKRSLSIQEEVMAMQGEGTDEKAVDRATGTKNHEVIDDAKTMTESPRKRGRPRKFNEAVDACNAVVKARTRGRPRKTPEVEPNAGSKKRGRPRIMNHAKGNAADDNEPEAADDYDEDKPLKVSKPFKTIDDQPLDLNVDEPAAPKANDSPKKRGRKPKPKVESPTENEKHHDLSDLQSKPDIQESSVTFNTSPVKGQPEANRRRGRPKVLEKVDDQVVSSEVVEPTQNSPQNISVDSTAELTKEPTSPIPESQPNASESPRKNGKRPKLKIDCDTVPETPGPAEDASHEVSKKDEFETEELPPPLDYVLISSTAKTQPAVKKRGRKPSLKLKLVVKKKLNEEKQNKSEGVSGKKVKRRRSSFANSFYQQPTKKVRGTASRLCPEKELLDDEVEAILSMSPKSPKAEEDVPRPKREASLYAAAIISLDNEKRRSVSSSRRESAESDSSLPVSSLASEGSDSDDILSKSPVPPATRSSRRSSSANNNRTSSPLAADARIVFPIEVKISAIKRIEEGSTQVEVARDLECPVSTVASWWQRRQSLVGSESEEKPKKMAYPGPNLNRKALLFSMKKRVEEAFKYQQRQNYSLSSEDNTPCSSSRQSEYGCKAYSSSSSSASDDILDEFDSEASCSPRADNEPDEGSKKKNKILLNCFAPFNTSPTKNNGFISSLDGEVDFHAEK